ncbi:hypothetical protein [Paludisphaera sp.]|uniref:hypothetical protein n=1 Tax=Paludisphaera sp. TaxID=2017432 RepID=UPI00301C4749
MKLLANILERLLMTSTMDQVIPFATRYYIGRRPWRGMVLVMNQIGLLEIVWLNREGGFVCRGGPYTLTDQDKSASDWRLVRPVKNPKPEEREPTPEEVEWLTDHGAKDKGASGGGSGNGAAGEGWSGSGVDWSDDDFSEW